MRTPFDKREFIRRLQRVGVDEDQAEEHVDVLRDMASDHLVMKPDLDRQLLTLEQKLTIKFGGMLVVGLGVLFALLRLAG